jgi:hypothetical protein
MDPVSSLEERSKYISVRCTPTPPRMDPLRELEERYNYVIVVSGSILLCLHPAREYFWFLLISFGLLMLKVGMAILFFCFLFYSFLLYPPIYSI